MADLKKRRKKESSGSPNIVLVIFLILFVLTSIILGVFTYAGYAGQAELLARAEEAEKKLEPEKKTGYYYKMLYREALAVTGDVRPEDLKDSENDRDAFVKGTFVTGKDDAAKKKMDEDAKAFIAHYEKHLNPGKKDGEARKGYAINLKQVIAAMDAEIVSWEARAKAAEAKRDRADDVAKKLLVEQSQANAKAWAKILKDSAEAMAKAEGNNENFSKTVENNRQLIIALGAKDGEITALKSAHADEIVAKDRMIEKIRAEQKLANEVKKQGGGDNVSRPVGDPFPLLLDLNTAKPLWDHPVGKIIRVDLEVRQVAINLGSAHGVKPELTFNIFGANVAGRAEKAMKGTIEVVKVLDSSTSLCRITSLYDAEGREILLNLDTRTRLARETESPIREGDLLFNLFWGTRVAIDGYINITGDMTHNPSEQVQQMEDFMYLLKRNGMIVDAFVDPRDGQIKGNITPRTRYLIKGHALTKPEEKIAPGAAPKEAGDDKDKKEPPKEALANAERIELINRATETLRKDAVSKGLLLISAENFVNVIGYRRARAANSIELSTFSPRLPYAGSGEAGVRDVPPPAPGPEDKKGMERP